MVRALAVTDAVPVTNGSKKTLSLHTNNKPSSSDRTGEITITTITTHTIHAMKNTKLTVDKGGPNKGQATAMLRWRISTKPPCRSPIL